MKKVIFSLMIVLVCASLQAQLTLPAPSPKASVMQTVGLTEITIDYSSPGVKGRTIWGDLLPYDKVWRAGANAATKITFSKDVTINGTAVPKGSYSVLITPTKADWIIHINKNPSVSENDHKKEEDIVKITAKPQTIPVKERLAYTITDFSNESAMVNMEWEKIKVSFTVNVDTDKQAKESIDKTLGGLWNQYNNAARYMLEKKDYDAGLKYADESLKIKEEWFNNWVKAQLLAGKGNKKEALIYAKKAKELGDKLPNQQNFFFKNDVEKAIKDWEAK